MVPRMIRLLTAALAVAASAVCQGGEVLVASVVDAITPASGVFIAGAIDRAEKQGAECVIVELDTPGGPVESMRLIVKRILASRVPVIVYVAPSGAHAASAGTFVLAAAHIAAMAPGTTIGAAHPVEMGQSGPMDSNMAAKVTNDLAAYMRTLAAKRNRNAAWLEAAVRESVAISEGEALATNVVDLIATNRAALLQALDGRTVRCGDVDRTIRTQGATIVHLAMNWRDRFLAVIANPSLAYVLFMLGLLGLYFEFANPGTVLPGVVGTISLILAFFAFQVLPVNYAGVMLILLAILLFILDVKAATHGVLSAGGVVAMFIGSVMLFDSPDPGLRLSLTVIVPVVAATAAFFILGVWLSIRAMCRKPTTGAAGLIGEEGDARTDVGPGGGTVFVAGAHWNAVSDGAIAAGARVRVVATIGMALKVEGR